jgi:hypothetical protein
VPNRIDQTPAVITIPRQTPKNDFGEVLSRTVNGALKMGGGLIQSTVGGMPIVSAAVSAVQSLAGNARSVSNASQAAIPVASVPGSGIKAQSGSISGGGVGADKYTDPAVQQMYEASQEALGLQLQVQQESREYNAITNVLKVRHDSAKSAINNIR